MSKPVVNTKESVFFHSPKKLLVDEDAKTRYSTSLKIDVLIQELKEKGPHVAFGWMGPTCYDSKPIKLNTFGGKEIFYWQSGTRSEKSVAKTYAIVLGARKVDGKGYVYFTLSADLTTDTKTYIREHWQQEDSRVFISTNKTFYENLFDLYPPVVKEKTHPNFVSSGSISCSPAELEYVIKLVSIMPLDDILGTKKAEVKELGQEIFDRFKKENNGSSAAGRDAAVNICDALKVCAKDGKLRSRFVETAWDGIGDKTWRWCA